MPGRRSGGSDRSAAGEGKYARTERERRFLLHGPPSAVAGLPARLITDRYLTGTRLRLRLTQREGSSADEYKLTQKVPMPNHGGTHGLVTSTYLNGFEYELLASLPAAVLTKTRISAPPLGIDVFHGSLTGLVMAEAEFDSDAACDMFVPPAYCVAEVTHEARFAGGSLVGTDRSDVLAWLAEFGIAPFEPG